MAPPEMDGLDETNGNDHNGNADTVVDTVVVIEDLFLLANSNNNTAVPAADVVVAVNEANGVDNHSSDSDRRRNCYYQMCCWCWVIGMFAVFSFLTVWLYSRIIGNAVTSTSADNGMSSLVPSMAPTTTTALETTTLHRVEWKTRLLGLLDLDEPLHGTPQAAALDWLVHDDFELITMSDDADELTTARVQQRYALTVLHLATGRWNRVGGWATDSGARHHECTWTGAKCDFDTHYQTVYSLELNSGQVGRIQGSLPTEVGLLTHLGEFQRVQSTRCRYK